MRKNVKTRPNNTTQFKQREAFYCNHVHCTTSICCLVADVGNSHWNNPPWNVWKMNPIICIHDSMKKSLPTLISLITCKSDQEASPALSRAREMNKNRRFGPRHPSGGARQARHMFCQQSRADLSIANSFLAACEKDPLAAWYCGGSIGLPLLNAPIPASRPLVSSQSTASRRVSLKQWKADARGEWKERRRCWTIWPEQSLTR